MKSFNKTGIFFVFALFFLGLTSCDTTSATAQTQYTNPSWAPPQYAGVRYYYMPDIETYYDLTNHDFIYLDNGQWLFSSSLPPQYSSYDLYDAYFVALNSGVYQPWMHHQLYISNYPRYYYRNHYQGDAFLNLRGFNENDRKPFYWKQEDRNRMNDLRRNDRHDQRHEPSREPQRPHYYGKNLGQPVKVRPQMRENRQGTPRNNQSKPDNKPDNKGRGNRSN